MKSVSRNMIQWCSEVILEGSVRLYHLKRSRAFEQILQQPQVHLSQLINGLAVMQRQQPQLQSPQKTHDNPFHAPRPLLRAASEMDNRRPYAATGDPKRTSLVLVWIQDWGCHVLSCHWRRLGGEFGNREISVCCII